MAKHHVLLAGCMLGLTIQGGCGQPTPQPSAPQSSVPQSPAVGQLRIFAPQAWQATPTRQDVLPGFHLYTTELEDGRVARFAVLVPDAYVKDRARPLVLSLHYGGEVSPYYGAGMVDILVRPALEELGAIILAPDSLDGPWSTETNERAVLHLLKIVQENFNIDPDRTLVTGFSMGGSGTWSLGGKHQDLFQAALPISARPDGPDQWRIPVYVIHSRDDGLIALEPVARHVSRLEEQGCDVTLRIVEGIPHFETPRFAEPLRGAVPWIQRAWDPAKSTPVADRPAGVAAP